MGQTEVSFYQTLTDFWKSIPFWRLTRIRPFVLLDTTACTYSWVRHCVWWLNKVED